MKIAADCFSGLNKEARGIFGMVQKNGPLTKNDLLKLTGTNLTTLNRIVQPMEEKRLIVETGIGDSSGGRKPILYDVNTRDFLVAGIEISRLYTLLIITDFKMNIMRRYHFPMDETCTPERTVRLIATGMASLLQELKKLQPGQLLGVGLGTVGPLERELGIMTNQRNFPAPGWSEVPIKDLLVRELNLPIIVDNAANTAILAEAAFGDGRGFRNIAYFNCGIGIRTGAISDGNIVRTINDAEDAFGHMVIHFDGERCVCGNYGCIDCYSSIFSVVRKFRSALKRGRHSGIAKVVDEIGYTDICRAAEAEDALAKEIIIDAATVFGAGLANYINLLDPTLVILSGPLVTRSDLFYQTSIGVASERIYSKKANQQIVFNKGGRFGDDAVSLGGAAMVVEKILSE